MTNLKHLYLLTVLHSYYCICISKKRDEKSITSSLTENTIPSLFIYLFLHLKIADTGPLLFNIFHQED